MQQIVCPFTVRDASTEDDLARIAAEICTSILPVGSAGLALHVFRRDSSGRPDPGPPASPASPSTSTGRRDAPPASSHPPASTAGRPLALASPLPAAAGPWIVLIGSDQPASQIQLQYIAAFAPPDLLLNPGSYPDSVAGVFATGGETASHFLRHSGAQGLTGLRELLPGIPAGLILGGRYNGTVMITKAGGFGAPDAVLRAIQSLQ